MPEVKKSSETTSPFVRPTWSSQTGVLAAAFIVALLVAVALFISTLVSAFQQQSISSFLSATWSSPWALATLVDYITGAFVTALWLATRTTQLTPLPDLVWAVFLPGSGNPLLFLYLSLATVTTRSAFTTLLAPTRQSSNAPTRAVLYGVGLFLTFMTTSYFALLVYAWAAESLATGYLVLHENPLVFATLLDNLMGVSVAAAIIIARERPNRLVAWLWVAALGLLGHGVWAVYSLTVVRDALREDVQFGYAFATSHEHRRPRDSIYV
jgi:uncharacterized integral membrane protein